MINENELIFPSFTADPEGPGCCALLLALVSILLIIATLPFSLCMCIKVSAIVKTERKLILVGPFISRKPTPNLNLGRDGIIGGGVPSSVLLTSPD